MTRFISKLRPVLQYQLMSRYVPCTVHPGKNSVKESYPYLAFYLGECESWWIWMTLACSITFDQSPISIIYETTFSTSPVYLLYST